MQLATLRIETEELAYTVEDNHLIVDRVTDSGQDGTDEGLVNFERERQDAPEDRVGTEDDDGIAGQGGYRTDTVGNVAEAEQDVETDGDEGQDNRPDG